MLAMQSSNSFSYRVLLITILFPISSFSQTCILILRTDTAIFVAADTKRTTWDVNGIARHDTVCKIRHVRNIFFSLSGLDIENAYKIATNCAKSKKRIREIINEYRQLMRQELTHYVDSVRKNYSLYQKYFRFLQNYAVCFYGFEHNAPITGSISFTLKNNINEPTKFVDTTSFTSNSPPNLVNVIRLGEHEAVDKYLNSDFINNYGLGGGLIELIRLQIKETPDHVGEPIELLEITKSGYKWLIHSACCD